MSSSASGALTHPAGVPAATNHIAQLLQHSFLSQASDLARECNDSIKDEIWHELAQVQYMHWEHETAVQLQSQQQLQERMQQLLQLQYHQEATAQVQIPTQHACLYRKICDTPIRKDMSRPLYLSEGL